MECIVFPLRKQKNGKKNPPNNNSVNILSTLSPHLACIKLTYMFTKAFGVLFHKDADQ